MTKTMDKLFVKVGHDAHELQADKSRSFLYFGIVFMLGFTLTFTALALNTFISKRQRRRRTQHKWRLK